MSDPDMTAILCRLTRCTHDGPHPPLDQENHMSACCEGQTVCIDCGRRWCRAEEVSPGEDRHQCLDCYEKENAA